MKYKATLILEADDQPDYYLWTLVDEELKEDGGKLISINVDKVEEDTNG